MKPSISLCMIVKDEENQLSRCLSSIKPFVNEIIVVDTGSKDRTVEIAKSFGARVFHHPWENDFAKHRNQSISYATGDWILRMDADEELFSEDGPLLLSTVKAGKADYYFCEMHDIKRDGSEHGVYYQLRLFRNHMGMRFERPVHEQLLVKGKGDYARIRIRHYGYDLSPEQMEEKHHARLAVLEDILRKNPDDYYSRNELAACYSMHRDFAEAIKHGEIILQARRQKNLKNTFIIDTYYTVGQGYLALGKIDEGEGVFREALHFFPSHLDACYFLSLIHFSRREWENCRNYAVRYLKIHRGVEKDPSLLRAYYCHHLDKKSETLFRLAACYFFEGNEKEADEIFHEAFEASGLSPEMAQEIARLYGEAKKEEEALAWLARAWEAGLRNGRIPSLLERENRFFYQLGHFYLRNKNTDQALACLSRSDDNHLTEGEKVEKHLALARLHWEKRDIETFISHLSTLVEISGARTLRLIDKIEDIGTVLYDIAQALEEKANWYPALLALKFALEIHPHGFDRQRFATLLKKAALSTGHPNCT